MTEHGIWTTAATHWAHLHPLEPAFYHYAVDDCRKYISENELIPIFGHSKDRSATGSGYLIKKNAPFVRRVAIRPSRIACLDLDWQHMTDHEAGLIWGEPLILLFVRLGILGFEPDQVVHLGKDWAAQLQSRDFDTVFGGRRMRWEGKTERIRSENLFVQKGENRHKPHLHGAVA